MLIWAKSMICFVGLFCRMTSEWLTSCHGDSLKYLSWNSALYQVCQSCINPSTARSDQQAIFPHKFNPLLFFFFFFFINFIEQKGHDNLIGSSTRGYLLVLRQILKTEEIKIAWWTARRIITVSLKVKGLVNPWEWPVSKFS